MYYTFTYQKISLHTLLLFVFKIVESFQCNLNIRRNAFLYVHDSQMIETNMWKNCGRINVEEFQLIKYIENNNNPIFLCFALFFKFYFSRSV